MIRLYGIKTCDTVRKARRWLESHGIDYEFVDMKATPVGCETIDRWLEKVDMTTLFNKRGTKYRLLKLKELELDGQGMREWLCKENLLIKRPVLEQESGEVVVGFKPEIYESMVDSR